MTRNVDFSILKGETIIRIDQDYRFFDELVFTLANGKMYKMHHAQDCCEDVNLVDICGDLTWLIGSPILQAECVESEEDTEDMRAGWTFYKLATIQGYVTLRWYGTSNGSYSVGVNFEELERFEDV